MSGTPATCNAIFVVSGCLLILDAQWLQLAIFAAFSSGFRQSKGVLRQCLRLAFDLVACACDSSPAADWSRAWKLLLFAPRMLLHRPRGGIRLDKAVVLARFQAFLRGEWAPLLDEALSQPLPQSPNFSEPDAEARARRATHLAHLGELSAARQALLADPLAPPTQGTFEALSNAERRPPEPYTPVDPDLAAWDPPVPVVLNRVALLANLRRARKGAAPGPSGLTAEMLRVVLDDADASQSFSDVASQLACARVPNDIVPALGLGRVVALSKPNGGTRGLVIGDFLRRLVARTLAQQYAAPLAEACHPHQYALGSRVGAEALIHEVQARCAADPRLTVVSLDAAAAYDGMSRQTVLRELKEVPEASALLPFVRLWLGRTSTYCWQQGARTRHLQQGEGVEQGDPLSPALFSLGLRAALRDLQLDVRPDLGECILAYLDDVTILANPQRALDLIRRFERHLAFHTRLCLNLSKTAIWNGAGVAPDGLHALSTTSRTWLGDSSLAPAQRGLVVLGAPLGTPEFVQAHLQQTLERQATLLNQLPNLHDTQVGWLLLSCCACPRAQYALRTLPTASTHEYAIRHDAAVLRCLDSLLFADAAEGLPGQVAARVQLALRHGGLGLRSAARHAPAALGHPGPTPSQPCSSATALSPFDSLRAWKQAASCQSCCHFKRPATLCPPLVLKPRPGTTCSTDKSRAHSS